MMNAGNLKGKTRQTSDWRRRMIAFVSALTLLISSCGLTAFAETDEDIYSNPVTAPIPAANTSPEPEEGEAEATPAPEGQPEEGTEPQEAAGEGTEPEGEPEVSEEPEDLTVYEPGTLAAEADGVGITVDYTAEARVPEGTVLTLTRAAGGDLYSALKSASKVLKTEENATWKRELGEDAVFYAIALTDSEGNEVHPETGVTLTCTNLEIPADATGFVTGENAENLDWKDTLTVGFLPDAIGYAYLKQVQIGTVTLTHEDRDYMVTAAYGPDAGFPAETELKVREILPGTPEYALYSGMTDEALNEDWAEITLERYFDIAFVANGEELEPKADVDVQIVFRDKIEQNEETEVAAVHIENNEANVIEAETDSTKTAVHDNEAIDTVTFTSDSFSVYGVVQKKKITKKVLAADGKTYDINVSYGPEAEIPEGADLNVREILPEDENFESYLNDAMRAASDESEETPLQTEYARFFDIEIVADGQKVEPKSAVSVSISLTDEQAAEQSDLCVVHFDEEKGAVVLEAEAETASDIQFEAESFSVYGVITYPTAQPQGVADLGGRECTIQNGNRYMTSTLVTSYNNVESLEVSTDNNRAATWIFGATGQSGKYSIFTIKDGNKKYINMSRKGNYWANIALTDTPQEFEIYKNNNNTYTIIGEDQDARFFLSVRNGHFAGVTGDDKDSNHEMSLTFEDAPTVAIGEYYAIIVQSQNGGDYYAVQNDGTLQKVDYDPETNKVKMDYPLFWEYAKEDGTHYNLRIKTLASGFGGNNLPTGYYYRYLDPNQQSGISEEKDLNTNNNDSIKQQHNQYMSDCAIREYSNLRVQGYWNYLGIDLDSMKIKGNVDSSNAAVVYFAKVDKVPSASNADHVVNHIDISIKGGASLSVPLEYGDYYYFVDGVRHDLTVDISNPVTLTLTKDKIDIEPEDMKHASITAYSQKSGVMNDAFYITGYSQNHENTISTAQVRLEGAFRVADLPKYDKAEDDLSAEELKARKDNCIYYTITVSKKENFPWEYEYEKGKKAQLYSAITNQPLSSNTTVNLGKSFNYWDENNECPPIKEIGGGSAAPSWRQGHIIGVASAYDSSGMDFELQATVNLPTSSVAIHITKEILTTSGEVLHPRTTVNNDFIVYQKSATPEDISAVTTVGMGEGSTAVDYTGYVGKHTKRISISSTDDNGTITDYDVDRDTMVCIEENAESIPEYITDAEGAKWKYVRTYIETPYAWRQKGDEGKEHVAEGTKSVPEVLGAYGTYVDDNGETQQLFNRVQEFHVHNIYAKVETITAEKLWQDVSGYALNESEYIIDYPNITLQLYEEGGNDPVSVKELNKGNEWKCEWADLDADKSYYVKEATVLDTTKYESPIYIVNGTVADEGTALQYGTVQVVNRKKELKVKLRKCLKGNTKAPVEGAVFEIHHADRYPDNTPLLLKTEGAAEPATSFTSNAEGNFYIGYLPVGTYVIKETEAPSEYTLMDPVEFEILDEEHVDVIQATGVKRYLRYRTWGSTSDGDWQYKSIGDKGYFNLYCEDVPSKTITITKKWFVNGTETSPSEGSITFDLYRTNQDFDPTGKVGANDGHETVSVNLINDQYNGVGDLSPVSVDCYEGGKAKFRLYFNTQSSNGYDYNGTITRNDGQKFDYKNGYWQYHISSDAQYVEVPVNANTESFTFASYGTKFNVEFVESIPPETGSSGETVTTTSTLPGTREDLNAITEKELVGNYTISASSSPAWTYDSGNTLEKYDYSGATPVEWTYFAIERSVSGYTDTYEYDSDGNITIKNSRTYTPEGSLKITKVVTVNDAADISTITNGTYSFSVSGVAGTPTAGITHTVSVTFANGKATSYQIDSNEAVTVTGTDNTWSVVLTNLTPGDYTITETSSGPLALKSITGGKIGTVNLADKSVVATVTDEDHTPTTEAAQVVFTNNINTNAMVEVPVEKTWDDFRDAGFGWSITLKLQYLLHYISGPENIADNLWHDYDILPSIEHQITLTKAESDSSATINGTFGNLPKYCFENGSIYEYEYSAVETAYTVTKNGETLYSKSVDTFEGEKQYESVFDHNANSNQDGNYVIQLHNSVPTLNDSEPMTLTIEKTWEDASDLTGFSAEFVIKRYKQNAYRDLSGISNEDNTRKVRIVDGSNTIYENTYPVGSKYQIQVEFVTDHNNQSVIMNRQPDNTRIEINPNNPISAIYDVTDGDGDITINIQERGYLVRSIVATDELVGGIATKDSSYEESFTLSNSSGWSKSVTVTKKITKRNEAGTQENITIYSYYLTEVSSTPDNYSASFKTSDNVKVTYKERIGSSATIIAENKKVPSVKVLKQWRGVIDTAHYPTITFSLYQELVGSNRAATVFVDEQGKEYSGIELSKEKNNWEWDCKVILPAKVDGYKARYYVKEDVTQGTDSSGRIWWLNDGYSRDNFAESGNSGEYNRVYLEEDPATGVVSGTFTIHNKMGSYVNMALKKKWVYARPLNNGTDNFQWDTLTQEDIWANTVLGIQLIRRVYTLDYTPLTDWVSYGQEVRVGYGPGGKKDAIHSNPNNEWFYLSHGDECWLWDIHNRDSNHPGRGNHDEGGLPAYGYYTKANGETVEVLYAYAFRETGVYSDLKGTPKDVSTWEYNSVSNWSWLTTGSIQIGYAADDGLLALLQKTENYLFPTLPPCAEWDRITNMLVPPIPITIEKVWVDKDGQEITPDDSATAIIQIGLKSLSGSESWDDITESTPLKFRINGETTDQLVITKTPKRYSATLVTGKYDEYILTELDPEEGAEDWTLKLEGLKKFYTTGKVVLHQCRYTVSEVEDDGYELVGITGNPIPVYKTVTITNREKETFVDIEATKTWYQAGESENINNSLTNAQVTFTLQKKVGDGNWTNVDIAGNPAVMSVTDADAEAWKASWTDLPKYEGENLISYKVVESDPTVNGTVIALPDVLEVVVDSDDFQEVEDNNPKATVNIDNVLPKKNVEVTKIWTDGETTLSWPTDIASVQVGLTQKVGDGATSPVQKDSSQWIENITAENNQKVIFSDLPVYDNTGALITYGIEEISITPTGTDAVVQPVSNSQVTVAGDSWTVTISDADGTVTNTKVKTDIHILKVKENMETPLTGASFRLQKLGESGYADYGDPALKAVDGDGKATFNDLTDGTYQLNEEVVPAGYNSINGPITFTITNGEVVEPDAWKAEGSLVKYKSIDSADTIVIGNTPGVELPSTGGSGTLIYTLTGIFLITLAGTLLVARKRKANR